MKDGGDLEAVGQYELTFPFADRFDDVASRKVGVSYLRKLEQVLEPLVDMLSGRVQDGVRDARHVAALVYAVAALARLQVALAYEVELLDESGCTADQVQVMLEHEWRVMVDRDQMVFVPFSSDIDSLIRFSLVEMWRMVALTEMPTAAALSSLCGVAVKNLRVVTVGALLLESPGGTLLSELSVCDRSKPVLPNSAYRMMLKRLKDLDVVGTPAAARSAVADGLELGIVTLVGNLAATWLWLVWSCDGRLHGYCYQLLVPPDRRLEACEILGVCPTVADVRWLCRKVEFPSATGSAVVVWRVSQWHVSEPGWWPEELGLSQDVEHIGMNSPATDTEVDYFARALIDDFFARNKPVTRDKVPEPTDIELGRLTLPTTVRSDGRDVVGIATKLYAGVQEMLSPRAEAQGSFSGGLVSYDEHVNLRDAERVQELYARLADGAAIHEDYFRRSRSRFKRRRNRPRLDATEGQLYHVFAGYPADGGGGFGPWQLDHAWDVPGWSSYVAEFDPGEERTVSFVDPDKSLDIRMDCTGNGMLNFGGARMSSDVAVLWFTHSVKFKITAKDLVTLRISIPVTGSSTAIGKSMRQYMHIPGYTIVAQNFDVVSDRAALLLPLGRQDVQAMSGCYLYKGEKEFERGRHRFKLSGLASAAPVKMILKVEPAEALDFWGICGMRITNRVKDYISVLVDVSTADTVVALRENALVRVSIVQIVKEKEFDLVLRSKAMHAERSVSCDSVE